MIFLKEPDQFSPRFEVVSCFFEYKGKILLVKRRKHKPQGGTWGVPAGKIDPGESPSKAIARELHEETSQYLPVEDFTLAHKVYVKYFDFDFIYYIFTMTADMAPEVKIKEDEHSEYIWKSPADALNLNLIEDLDACIKLHYAFIDPSNHAEPVGT